MAMSVIANLCSLYASSEWDKVRRTENFSARRSLFVYLVSFLFFSILFVLFLIEYKERNERNGSEN